MKHGRVAQGDLFGDLMPEGNFRQVLGQVEIIQIGVLTLEKSVIKRQITLRPLERQIAAGQVQHKARIVFFADVVRDRRTLGVHDRIGVILVAGGYLQEQLLIGRRRLHQLRHGQHAERLGTE